MATREKIFEFDTTQSVDNLKRLKAEIKELKEAMDQLEIGSKEYNETSDKLYAKQSRLSELMKEHKRPIEDVAGSFNDLNSKLRTLKEYWKATGDEMERAALTVQINEVKAQMNSMNESIGNFQHNVGNYTNSIIDAFGKMGISVTSLTAPLKKMGLSIEGVDTSIKLLAGSFKIFSGENLKALTAGFNNVSTSVGGFIKSLNGIKAAVLATGLGALVVLLGELVAHWDDVTDAVGRWIGVNQQAILSTDQITASIQLNNEETQFQLRLMKARGESEMAQIDYALKSNSAEIARLNTIIEENNALILNAKWWWERNKAIEASDKAVEEVERLEKERKKLLEDKEVLKTLQETQARLEKLKKTTQETTNATKQLKEAEEDVLEAIEKADQAEMDAETEALKKKYEEAQQLAQAEAESRKTELELEEESYQEKLALLKQFKLDTEALELNHLERMEELRKEQAIREEEEFKKHKENMDADDEKSEKKYENLMEARRAATMNMAKSTATILKNLSSAMGENTKLAKGFAIAAATIDTIASAVAGFRAGWNQWEGAGFMAWMAPVQAALNATMALTAGFAEVQKIRNVDTSGTSQGGGSTAMAIAVPNIEGLSSPMDYTRQVTTETEQEEMNRDQRVYILESDIQESGNRVRVREEETTF